MNPLTNTLERLGFAASLRPARLVSVEDYRRAALRALPAMVGSYVDGGADDMTTVADNRAAFGRWAFRPRALTGHGHCDLRTVVAGTELDLPVLLAPTGFTGLSRWDGDVAAVRAAEAAGTRYVLSSASSWSIEEVAAQATLPHFFQLYPREGRIAAELMRRAWSAGFQTMMVTVDVPVKGNREGELKTGMGIPPVLTPRGVGNMLRHPRWLYAILRHQRIAGRNLVEGGSVRAALDSIEIQERELMQSTLNWDDLAWMREQWPGALFVKGVLSAEDAKRSAALGAEGVVVSNHGGRQLDGAPASLDVLPEVVAAVGDQVEVLLDGGVRRGTDVLKAIALGARAVMIGRPYIYGLAVAGEAGATDVLRILREEIERALTLVGAASGAELDPSWLRPRPAAA